MLQRTPIVCLIAIITCLWINPSLTQDAKIYVSSFDGNNANSGSSEKEAVEDIATAFKLAASNNGAYVAILLAPGIYSNVNNLELDVPDNVIALKGTGTTIETTTIETTNSKVNFNATALIYCSSAWFLRINQITSPFQFTLSNLYTIDCESVLKVKHASAPITITDLIAEYSHKASHPSYAISADGASSADITLQNCAFSSSYDTWLRVFNATHILVELIKIRPTNETEPILPLHRSASFIDSKQFSISIKNTAIPSIHLFRSSGHKLMIQDSTIRQLVGSLKFSDAISLINVEMLPFALPLSRLICPKEFLIQNSTIKSSGPLQIYGNNCTDCSFNATDSSWQLAISIIDVPVSIITGCNFNSLLRVVNSNVTLQRQTVLSSGIEFQGGALTIQDSIITLHKVAVPNIIHVLTNNLNNAQETTSINLINVTIIEPITAHTIPTPYSMITGRTSIDLKISIEQFILNNAIKFERLVDVSSASILIQVQTKVSHSSFNNVSTSTPQLIATYNNGQTLLEHSNFTNVRAAGIGSIVINNDGIVQINDCNFSFNQQQVPAPATPSKAFLCTAGTTIITKSSFKNITTAWQCGPACKVFSQSNSLSNSHAPDCTPIHTNSN